MESVAPRPMAMLHTRAAAKAFFSEKRIDHLLRQYSIQLAVHQPVREDASFCWDMLPILTNSRLQEEPERFIYEQLRAKFAKADAPQADMLDCSEQPKRTGTAEDQEKMWRAAAASAGAGSSREHKRDRDEVLRTWSTLSLNGHSLREILQQADVNDDSKISLAEMKRALTEHNIGVAEQRLERAWASLSTDADELTLGVLEDAIKRAVDVKNLGDWLQDQKIHEILAERL